MSGFDTNIKINVLVTFLCRELISIKETIIETLISTKITSHNTIYFSKTKTVSDRSFSIKTHTVCETIERFPHITNWNFGRVQNINQLLKQSIIWNNLTIPNKMHFYNLNNTQQEKIPRKEDKRCTVNNVEKLHEINVKYMYLSFITIFGLREPRRKG